MRRSVATAWTFALIALTSVNALAQCERTANEWLDQLSEIERSSKPDLQKIEELSFLQIRYSKCSKNDSVYARIVHRLGDVYRLSGDFQNAIALTNEAVRINQSELPGAQKAYLTHSYYNLGLYQHLLNFPSVAHFYYDSCIAIGEQFPEKKFIALMALEKKAFMYFQSGDYERSIQVAEYGRSLALEENDPEFESLLLIQKSQAEAELNRVRNAEENILKAIGLLTATNSDSYLPNAYSVYGNVLSRKGNYTEAVGYYQKAYKLNLDLGNVEQAARDLHDLALLYSKELNDFNKTMETYAKVIKLQKSLNDPYLLATTYNNMGQAYWRIGNFKKALGLYQQGLMVLPFEFDAADLKNNPSLEQLKTSTNAYVAAALLWNKGDAWFDSFSITGDSLSLQYSLAAYRLGDHMVDLMRWKQQGEQSKLFWRAKTKAWYAKAVEASFLRQDALSAFYFMEKSRAVLLNDKLSELGARAHLPADVRQTESKLRLNLESALHSDPNNVFVQNRQWEARENLNRFLKKLETNYPAYYRYKYDTTVCSLKTLQQNLNASDQVWVELFSTPENIYALVVRPTSVDMNTIDFAEHERIARHLLKFNSSKALLNSRYDEFSELSVTYASKVFVPLGINEKRVVISQDEYFIPFDLLLEDKHKKTSFLLKKHAFSYAYAATHTYRETNKETTGNTLLGIAPVSYHDNLKLEPLSGADESLNRIAHLFNDVTIRKKDQATMGSFLSMLPNYDFVHLYSHAEADSIGTEPVIYFRDSALRMSDLQSVTDIRAKAIFLFACNTGIGKNVKGEGTLSMARGFASVGIPSTISALWRIDNESSYALAELFFKHLHLGKPVDIALQEAKLELVDVNAEYELPYYWAANVLIGNGDLRFEEKPAQFSMAQYGLYVIAFLGLIAVIYYLWTRSKARAVREIHE